MVKSLELLQEPGKSLCCSGGSRARRGWAVPSTDEAGFGALSLRVLVKLMNVFSFARN